MAVNGKIQELNNGSLATTTAIIKTKRFDFELPEERKRFNHIILNYKSGSAVSVDIYVDGSASSSQTLSYASQVTVGAVSKKINVTGKTIELKVSSADNVFALESLSIEYALIPRTP
jgi:hypothetical protein